MLGQSASDTRWEETLDLLRDIPADEAEAEIERALQEIDGEAVPGAEDERIGGALDAYVPPLVDSEIFRRWEGREQWRTLCVLDRENVRRYADFDEDFDVLVAVVATTSSLSTTGIWVLA